MVIVSLITTTPVQLLNKKNTKSAKKNFRFTLPLCFKHITFLKNQLSSAQGKSLRYCFQLVTFAACLF